MERLESSLSDPALCLQDLVTGVTTSSANSDIHGHHHLHDAAVSVSSAISGIMSGTSSSVLGHHVTSHEPPHHHGVVPHTPSLHHEPLEKLKRVWAETGDFRDAHSGMSGSTTMDHPQLPFPAAVRSRTRDRKDMKKLKINVMTR